VALFEDESLDAAIGRNGMNINLASKITDYRIDAYGINQYQRIQEDQKTLLMDIEGVDKKIAKVLLDSNIKVVSDLLDADMDNLLAINSITEDILDDIYTSVQDFVERKIEIPSIDEGDDEQDDVENPDLENKPVTEPVE
jgi:N utilization substance protein A